MDGGYIDLQLLMHGFLRNKQHLQLSGSRTTLIVLSCLLLFQVHTSGQCTVLGGQPLHCREEMKPIKAISRIFDHVYT